MESLEQEASEILASEAGDGTAEINSDDFGDGNTSAAFASEGAGSPENAATGAGAAVQAETASPMPAAEGTISEPRAYRPTDDYTEGERIYHLVWDAIGVVKHRDPREHVFRVSVGGVDEPGRCNLIRVEFDKEVPATGGPKREVVLVANWRGRALAAGAPSAPRTPVDTLKGFGDTEDDRPAGIRSKDSILPDIPVEPDEVVDEVVEEAEEEGDTEEF